MIVKKIDYVKAIVQLESTNLTEEQMKHLNIIKKYVNNIENKTDKKWRSNMKERDAM